MVDFRNLKKWHIVTSIELREFVVFKTGWHKFTDSIIPSITITTLDLGSKGQNGCLRKGVKAVAGTWGAANRPLWHYPLSQTIPWLDEEQRKKTGRDTDLDFPEDEVCHRILIGNGITTIEKAGRDIDPLTEKGCPIAAFSFRCKWADGVTVRLVGNVEE